MFGLMTWPFTETDSYKVGRESHILFNSSLKHSLDTHGDILNRRWADETEIPGDSSSLLLSPYSAFHFSVALTTA